MGILETLRGKLGAQPIDVDLANSLRAAKKQSDAERKANLRKAAQGQKAVELQYEQQVREKKIAVDKLGQRATKLFKPTLEAIKKSYLGPFKGKIVLEKDYESDKGVLLELKWRSYTTTVERGMGRNNNIVPVEKGKHFYFQLRPDGTAQFGPVWGERSEIDVDPSNEDWKKGLAEKIQQAITPDDYGYAQCNYEKKLPQ